MVARRLAHHHYVGAAVHQWAFCSLARSGWAREFYDQKIAAGKSHHAALSNRWLEIPWHCLLTKNVLYDENVYVANRNGPSGLSPDPRASSSSDAISEGVAMA